MFGGHTRQSQTSASSATTTGIDSEVNQIGDVEGKLSKNSRQCKNKISKQKAQIKSLQNQNQQLQSLLDANLLVNVVSQAVTTSLK